LEQQTRKAFQEIIFALLYIILFLVLMPPLIRLLDDLWGKILYGVLVAGAVAVAFRLRALSRR